MHRALLVPGVPGSFAGKGDTGADGAQGPAGYVANTLPQKYLTYLMIIQMTRCN